MMASVAQAIGAFQAPHINASLTQHYKGITLNQPVRIVAIDSTSATVQTTQRHIFPTMDGRYHLRCGAVSGAITGQLHPVDFSQGTFVLSELSYAAWRDRHNERVQPKTPTYVALHLRQESYRAYIEDISIDGMGILASKDFDPRNKLRVGAKVSLDFHLQPDMLFTHVKGVLVYRHGVGRRLLKLGLHLFLDEYLKSILQGYIVRRYDEILDELEQETARLHEPRHTEDLFF
jgi:hypothetical protein